MSLATLLDALHAGPADRLGWLALADCLEEQDESDRAELMRLFVLTREQNPGAERRDREARVRQLLTAGVLPCVPGFTNSLGMTFSLIPPGAYLMGSPEDEPERDHGETLHEVTLSRPFYCAVHPITQDQYETISGQNPSRFCATGENAGDVTGLTTTSFPAENIAWGDAVAFCKKLTALPAEKKAKLKYRLPTEAEWEYACRGAGLSSTPFHWGDGFLLTHEDACFDSTRPYPIDRVQPGPWLSRPVPVGSYLPNVLGLYDMHGNVWEWCSDWFDGDYYDHTPERDPPGPKTGEHRVLRGGSWFYNGPDCRAGRRYRWRPEARHRDHGFRVVCTLGATK